MQTQASSSADVAGSAGKKYPDDPAIKSSADLAKSAADDAAKSAAVAKEAAKSGDDSKAV
ncbi:hypothetical protein [Lacticaseibacillus paracasei]|uniref:hypothetical protein n=1 Tax=Lacticaseibacillus paracasei TaxID=1597 RepID=UPI003AAE8FB0